jgi:phage-related protein
MGPMRVSQYIGAFLGQKHEFINAAIETMKAIRDGLNAKQPQFVLSVEDGTCSAARLRERVNRWKF